MSHSQPDALRSRLEAVSERVVRAAEEAGRDPSEVTTIVVTKFHPVELVRNLYDLGVRDFGESRHQEAREKAAALPADIRWHFVGQLQTKKARQVRTYAHSIHSVDRLQLVDALDGADDETEVFVQVDLSGEPGRGGAAPADVPEIARRVVSARGLRLAGVMAVAPLGEDAEPAFRRLREISDRVREIDPDARRISAGMSGDLESALKEGATHLRVGSAITGQRPTAP